VPVSWSEPIKAPGHHLRGDKKISKIAFGFKRGPKIFSTGTAPRRVVKAIPATGESSGSGSWQSA